MLQFFTRKDTSINFIRYGHIRNYTNEYLQRKILTEMNDVKQWYMNREIHVMNTHLLTKLVFMLMQDYTLDDFTYLRLVEDSYIPVCNQLGIVTNSTNYKTVHSNIFYNSNSTEILVASNFGVNTYNIQEWDTIPVIRVIYTTNTDLDYNIPYGSKDLPVNTLNMYEIDVPLMMLQYKHWCMSRANSDKSLSTSMYIAMVVLPNILDSIVDFTIYNRFIALYKNGMCAPFNIKQHIAVTDVSPQMDKILMNLLRTSVNVSKPLDEILNNIPTIVSNNMVSVLTLTKKYYTRQSEWVLWLARINIIVDLIDMLGVTGRTRNYDILNNLPAVIRKLHNRKTEIEKHLPEDITATFYANIEKINSILGER